MLSSAGDLSKLVIGLAELQLLLLSVLRINELREGKQLAALILVLLLALSRLALVDLLLQLSYRIVLPISELSIDITAASQYLQIIAQKQIVVLSSRHFQEVSILKWLWNAHSIVSCEYMRALNPCLRHLAT